MADHRASDLLSDLLYESEAALRLVDDALHRLIDLPANDVEDDPSIDALSSPDAPSTTGAERREGLERALLLLGELDAGHGRVASR